MAKSKKNIAEPQFMAPPGLADQMNPANAMRPPMEELNVGDDEANQAAIAKMDMLLKGIPAAGLGLDAVTGFPFTRAVGGGLSVLTEPVTQPIGRGLSSLASAGKAGIDTTISNVASNPIGTLYPAAVTADMIFKGLNPEMQTKFKAAYEANPAEAVRMFGSELGKSATGETLTKDAGPNAGAPAYISSLIGGLLGGIGKGVGSAVNYVDKSIVQPLGQGINDLKEGVAPTAPLERIQNLENEANATFRDQEKAKIDTDINNQLSDLQAQLRTPNISFEKFKGITDQINALKASAAARIDALPAERVQAPSNLSAGDANKTTVGAPNWTHNTGMDLGSMLKNVVKSALPIAQAAIPISPQYAAINADEEKNALARQVQALKAMQSAEVNAGKLDLKTEQGKELTRWMASSKDVDDVANKIDFAIKTQDPSVIALVVNKLAGISSVAIQQGVVSDEEARRVLNGVMSNYNTIAAGGFQPKDVQRMLSSDTWKSVKNFAGVVQDGLKARMGTYRDIYDIPDSFFTKAKIDLTTPKSTAAGSVSEDNSITQSDIDKANYRANMKAKFLQGANTVEGFKQLWNGAIDATGVSSKYKVGDKGISNEQMDQGIDAMYAADKAISDKKNAEVKLQKGVQALVSSGYTQEEALKALGGIPSAAPKPPLPPLPKARSLQDYDSITQEAIKQAQAGDANSVKYLGNKGIKNWKNIK